MNSSSETTSQKDRSDGGRAVVTDSITANKRLIVVEETGLDLIKDCKMKNGKSPAGWGSRGVG